MLLWLGNWLAQFHTGFAVVNYLTLRAILAAMTALILALWFGPILINKLRTLQIGQAIREVGPKSHFSKAGTPTMGGVLILLALIVSSLLWGNLNSRFVWVAVLTTLAFAAIGWVDDYRKVIEKIHAACPAVGNTLAVGIGFNHWCVLFYSAQSPQNSAGRALLKNVMPQLGVFLLC